MNPRWMSGIVLAAGLLTCGVSFAQMGPMRAPMVPQAIGTHLEQKRTLEQREAIEAKAAAAPSPETVAPKRHQRRNRRR